MLLVEVAPHDPEVLTSCPSGIDEQVPNASWQPSAQYAEVLPQNPLEEQQLPKVEVRHVALVSELEPQLPSLLVGFERGRRREDELGTVRGNSSRGSVTLQFKVVEERCQDWGEYPQKIHQGKLHGDKSLVWFWETTQAKA